MKNKEIKKYLKSLKNVAPDKDFLSRTRDNLSLKIKQSPAFVIKGVGLRHYNQRSLKLIFANTKMIPLFLIFALVAGGGGTAYASQDSLPGETLYAVKLATEDVRLAIASVNSEKQAGIRIELAQKRVEEIQKVLAESGQKELAAKQEEALSRALDNFNSQLDKISAKAAEMKLKEEFQKAVKLNVDLAVASDIFKDVLAGIEGKSAEKINKKIEKSIERALKAKEDSENEEEEINDEEYKVVDIEGLKKNAQRWIDLAVEEIKAAETAVSKNIARLEESKLNEFSKKIEEAKKDLNEAIAFFGGGNFREAFNKAMDARKTAAKTELRVRIAPKGIIKKDEDWKIKTGDDNSATSTSATGTTEIKNKKEKSNGKSKKIETENENSEENENNSESED